MPLATVNSSGLVTAVGQGSATITVTTVDGNYTATSSVTVASATVPVAGVSVSPSSTTLEEGSTVQLSATISPSNASDQRVTLASSNTSIATVNSSGYVTAVSEGSAIITATTNDGGYSATSSVTVTAAPGGVTITLQENQNGFCSVDGSIDNNNAGFTGTGFANTDNATGKGIDYKVNASGGQVTLVVRYTNGSSDRPAKISVNGSQQIAALSMPGTGSWSSWSTVQANVSLNTGANDIRFEATSGGGLPNFDYLEVTGKGVSAGDCSGSTVTYTLTMSVNGQSSISPSIGTYDAGTLVNLTATAANGWEFDSWGGDASGTNATITVTMNANKSITANFSETTPPPTNSITLQENETGFCGVDGSVDNNNAGFTGTGFANTDNANGKAIECVINGNGGTYKFRWR